MIKRERLGPIFFLLLVWSSPALFGQSEVPPEESLGVNPAGAYLSSASETVNLYNGNLNVVIAVVSLRGRNGQNVVLSFAYNSLQIVKRQKSDGFSTYYEYELLYNGPNSGRWYVNNHPSIKFEWVCDPATGICSQQPSLVVLPDGGQHELKSLAGKYLTINSTHMEYNHQALTLFFKDGTRLIFGHPSAIPPPPSFLKDTNGNYITYNFDSWRRPSSVVDNLGRQISFYYGHPSGNNLLTRAEVAGCGG